jgi:putative membrane protein
MAQAPVQLAALRAVKPTVAVGAILAASAAALLLLVVVIYGHGRAAAVPSWVSWLPLLNAMLNAASAVFLLRAYGQRRINTRLHARNMLRALAASTLFLVSYILYHSLHGDTKFPGHGAIRSIYFFVLITHVALSAVVLPLIFSSFYFALSGRIRQHRAVARYTFPAWLYVSVTGVLVFVLLREYS